MTESIEPDLSGAPDVIKNLWKVVKKKFMSEESRINLPLDGGRARPFDEKAKGMLKDWAPFIETWGLDLRLERSSDKSWGGLLARIVEKEKDADIRCLQYVYVWLRQYSVISFHWLVSVPIIMTIVGLLIWWIFAPGIDLAIEARNQGQVLDAYLQGHALWPTLAFVFLWFETFLTGFGPYIRPKDPHKPDPHLRPALFTGLVFGPLSLLIGIYPLYWLFFSAVVIVFFCIVALIASSQGWLASHDMDYLPVFVWVKRIREDIWKPTHICWDYWHYFSYKKELEVQDAKDTETGRMKSYCSLRMDNPWHSVHERSESDIEDMARRQAWYIRLCIIIPVAFLAIAILYALPEFFTHAWRVFALGTIGFVLYIGKSIIAWETELIEKKEFDDNMHNLSHEWLVVLWNLIDKNVKPKGELPSQSEKDRMRHPRLVVISKMQRPFEEDRAFWTTFRDDFEYLYSLI